MHRPIGPYRPTYLLTKVESIHVIIRKLFVGYESVSVIGNRNTNAVSNQKVFEKANEPRSRISVSSES